MRRLLACALGLALAACSAAQPPRYAETSPASALAEETPYAVPASPFAAVPEAPPAATATSRQKPMDHGAMGHGAGGHGGHH